jgi:hypothetical protein
VSREASQWQSEKMAELAAASAELYRGLYDSSVICVPANIRLLNPNFSGDDPTSLRFAQLEVE